MATQATIQLVVDESGTVPGLTRFQQRAMQAFQGTRGEANSLNAAILKLSASIDGLGVSGKKSGDSVSAGFQKANGHALTSLDTVRLFRDDLGVHVPRAMEKLIASTEAFQVVAQTAFGVFAFVGVVELLGTIGSKLNDVAHELMGDTKAVQEMGKALAEMNDQEIINPKNAAVARDSLRAINTEIQQLEARQATSSVAKAANQLIFSDKNLPDQYKDFESVGGPERLIKLNEMRDKLLTATAELNRKVSEEDTRSARENMTVGLEAYRKIAQETANAKAEIDDQVTGRNGQNRTLTPKQGDAAKQLIDAKAAKEYAALSIETAARLRDAWQSSALARLRGEQRAYAEMTFAMQNYDAQARREGVPEADRNGVEVAMQEKYLNEKMQRQQQFAAETMRLADQVRIAESVGTQRMLAEETAALNQLTQERIDSGRQAAEFDQEYEVRRVQIHAKTEAQIAASVKTYGDQEQVLRDELNTSASHGYTQIDEERIRREDQALKKYQDKTEGLKATDQNYVDATAIYQRELQDIDAETEIKRKDLHQRNADEIAAIEDQAQSIRQQTHQKGLFGIFAEEQAQSAKINAEYNKRVREAQALDDGEVANHQAAMDKIAAFDDLRNEQMGQVAQGASEKLASAIESGFKDPMGAIKDQMKHEMAEIIANWLLQLGIFKSSWTRIMGSAPGAPGGAAGGGGMLSGLIHPTFGGSPSYAPPSAGGRGYSAPSYSSGSSSAQSFASSGSSDSLGVSTGGTGAGGGIGADVTTGVSAARQLASLRSSAGSGAPGYHPNSLASPRLIGGGSRSVDAQGVPMDSSSAGVYTANADGTVSGEIPLQSTPDYQTPNTSAGANAGSAALGVAGAGIAAYGAVGDTQAAFKSGSATGVMKGTLDDAMAGAAIGSLFGPEGMLIGAAAGAIVGAAAGITGLIMGEGGRLAARDYYKKTLFPQIEQERNNSTGGDYQGSITRVNKMATDGMVYMSEHWGGGAAQWVNDNYLRKEQQLADAQILARAQGGSYATSLSAAQFHEGGTVRDFGDLATSPTEGFIHAMLTEKVVKPSASRTHGAAIDAMNADATPSDIAAMYQRPSSDGGSDAGGNHLHLHLNTMDHASFEQYLDRGGARVINKKLNDFAGQYAGDGIG